MMLTWMLYCMATSFAVALAALLGEQASRLTARPGRWAWVASVAGALFLGAMGWLAPEALPRVLPPVAIPTEVLVAPGEPSDEAAPLPEGAPPQAVSSFSTAALDPELIALWVALSLGVALVLSSSALRLRRARGRWDREIVDGVPVLVSPDLGPAVVGFHRPEIVLPRWALDGDPEVRRLMIAHEREHQCAGDQWLVAGGLAMLALAPWNPVLWWQLRRLRHAIELDCDARVLASGENVRSYGELLFAVSHRPSRRLSFASAFAEPTSYLERRIHAMTARRPRNARLLAAGANAVGTILIFASCEMPRPIEPRSAAARPVVAENGEMSPMPTPSHSAVIVDSINRRHPEVFGRGIAGGQAVWFVLDGEDRMLSSWVAPNFTEERWKAFREEGRYPALDLGVTTYSVTDGTGKFVPVVWAEAVNPWEAWPGLLPREFDEIREYIASEDPSLLAGRVGRGQAVWIVEAPRAARTDPRQRKLWVAPVIADRKTQWEYLHAYISPGHGVTAVNFTVIGTTGQIIPVSYAFEFRPE